MLPFSFYRHILQWKTSSNGRDASHTVATNMVPPQNIRTCGIVGPVSMSLSSWWGLGIVMDLSVVIEFSFVVLFAVRHMGAVGARGNKMKGVLLALSSLSSPLMPIQVQIRRFQH